MKETLSEQNDRRFNYFRTNYITAVFGNPREIFLFNYSIQLKTSETWEDMKRKNDTPMVML